MMRMDYMMETSDAPEWFKAEHFEYCDSFFEETKRSRLLELFQIFFQPVTTR